MCQMLKMVDDCHGSSFFLSAVQHSVLDSYHLALGAMCEAAENFNRLYLERFRSISPLLKDDIT